MRNFLRLTGFVALLWCAIVTNADASSVTAEQVKTALLQERMTEVRGYVLRDETNVDPVVKGIMEATLASVKNNPAYARRLMIMASDYATSITPPSVPVVCTDLRRIVEALPEDQKGKDLHTTIVNTSQNYASAPVVVAAGRPNLCEDAWLQAANLTGDEALLFQNPGMRSPGLPPVTIGPTIPSGRAASSPD